LLKLRSTVFLISFVVACALFLISGGLQSRTTAQTNPVVIAPGFEFNIFADPTRVPEFALSAYHGPVSMAFDARGRLFVGTYSAKILILLDNNGDGVVDQVKTFASGVSQPLGLAFRANGDLFATSNVIRGVGSIVRLRDTDGDDVADERVTMVDGLPSEGDHQTDRLRFGPDGLLYFGQGSSTDNGTPQPGLPGERPLNATVLRVDPDTPGVITTFATGLRNPFGMAFHPENGELFTTDGGSGEFSSCSEESSAPPEEVNWVAQGGNYGFPRCEGTPASGNPNCAGVRSPVTQFLRHLTPTSVAFYTGPQAGADRNQMLVTLFKRLCGEGGDLRRFTLTGTAATGFQATEVLPRLADFGIIDPFDGPLETQVDPISGDIYVARFDPVTHRDLNEHHHFIYRIHRSGSDSMPFIGPLSPSFVRVGSGAVIINLVGRHLKPGAMVLADGVPLVTRQGSTIFDLVADLPATAVLNPRTIGIEVQNPDGARSNQQPFIVSIRDPIPDKSPQITLVQVKKKAKFIETVTAGTKAKKLTLIVTGIDFDASAQLMVNGVALELLSASQTELDARFTKPMVAAAGELTIQVRNSTGKVSNTVRLVVAAAE
jgi:glucose/arabinose dehydrogenase